MNRRPFKTYILEGEFYTDRDYWLDLDNWELKDDGFDKFFRPFDKKIDEDYHFNLQTDNILKVRDFLENLIVIYRCGRCHSYLIRELYQMTEKIKDALFDDDVKSAYEFISGNYSGTHITLTKIG